MTNLLAVVDIETKFDSPYGKTAGVLDLISLVLSNAMIIAGVILLVYFLVGGISIISSAGSNNPEGAAKGKQAMTSAATGFLLLFVSYWIIKLIEALTGLPILTA